MENTDRAEPAPAPTAKPETDQVVELDADAGAKALTAEDTEQVASEDTETKADEPAKDAESADGSDEDKAEREAESKKRRTRDKTRLASLMAENEALKRLVPQQDNAAALQGLVDQEIGPAPQEADFTDYLEFQNARIAYETEKRIVTRELKQRAYQAQEFQQAANAEIVETFRERADTARKTIKDFDEVTKAATVSPTDPAVIHMILTSEKAPELAYYLSKNPQVVHRLNEMPPLAAAREIGKLEASVSSATPRTVTKAQNPVPALRGGTTPDKDPDKMSMKEFDAYYQARVKAKQG